MKYMRRDKVSKPYTPVDVLKMALAKEESSVEFYTDMAGKIENPALKGLLKKLRIIEESHVQLIRKELEK